MRKKLLIASLILIAASVAYTQVKSYRQALVSFDDYKSLMAKVEGHRAKRLVDLDTFLKMSQEEGTIILDTRSDFRFERLHLKGAKHLSFTDFTQANLAKVIPTHITRILIYCNNNFTGNQVDFATKRSIPGSVAGGISASQMASQAKPIMLALNIPTYINLMGYGYENVYELDELVDVTDKRITLEGTVVTPKLPVPGTK
jgi:rhodanese-related sulfurtransferase